MPRPRRYARRYATALLLAGAVALTQAASSLAASGATVECGQLSAYTAPDPVAPASGSITIGLLPAWEIVASATVSSAAATALPTVVNSGPTCISMELDGDGKVTS